MTTTMTLEPDASNRIRNPSTPRTEPEADNKRETLPERINAEHESCISSANRALHHALRCGELLIEAKAACSHGEWGPWILHNFEGSNRTASAYMRIAGNREAIEAKRQS